ncbi:MAG: SAM-dependent methyltransferase, partial [Ilumatobacteraceae bacterium]
MPSAADEIRGAIGRAGTISFRDFMSLALYGEHGFYSRVGSAGRRGDFITSPEVGPLFGAVLARALDDWWRKLGSPSDFVVVEVGAGPGTLARAVNAARPECLRSGWYVAVEVSAEQRHRHPDSVHSVGEMPDGIECGVVIAN